MKLCEWCEQPVEVDNDELCAKCLDAQARVASGKLISAGPERKKEVPSITAQIGSGLLLVGKMLAALVLGLIMIGAALGGTCAGLIALFQLMSNPFGALLAALGAAVLFGISLLLGYLTWKMFDKPLRPVERPHLRSSDARKSIETNEDDIGKD